ncbi:hypothetical protein ACJ41O_004063 [Fusarium nematophilum]
MVGVPRSTGCQLCRARKVKCDESKPGCGNCVKYGVECPGYDRGLKFIAGKHQIRQRGKRSDNASNKTSTSSLASGSTSSTAESQDLVATLACRPGPLVNATPSLAPSLKLPRANVLYNMIESSFLISATTDIFGILSWVGIDRLGTRAVLDGAIMSDMFYPGKDQYFLSRPAWKQVMYDRGRHLIHPAEVPDDMIRVADGFFANLVEVPAVLKWGFLVLQANKAGISVDPARVSALAHLAAVHHASFARWYDEFTALPLPQPVEAAPADPTSSPFETVLVHEYPSVGAMHLGYWASMLILQETLTQCGQPVPDAEASQRDLVERILRSVESVGHGTMGPFRIGYSIRIAYDFATADEQRWVGSLLDRLSPSYAAVDRTLYPPPKDEVSDSGGRIVESGHVKS